MFAKFKEKVALFIEVSKAAYEISSDPLYMMFNKTTIAGKEVYVDNKVVLAGTGVKHIPNAVYTSTGVIVINEAVLQMPTAQQNALILHEYGHRVLKHRAIPVVYQFQLLFAFGNPLKMEFDADEYAVKNGGDMLSLLKHWWDTYPETRLVSLRKRIAKLEAYYAKFEPKFN